MHVDPHTHLILTNQRVSAAPTAVHRRPSTDSRGVLGSLRRAVSGVLGRGAARTGGRRSPAPAPARGGPAILAE